MAQTQIVRGSDEEIAAFLHRLKGRRDLTLIVPAEDATVAPQSNNAHFYLTATQEEFQAAFDALGAEKEHQPVPPPEAYDRENLYDEDRF